MLLKFSFQQHEIAVHGCLTRKSITQVIDFSLLSTREYPIRLEWKTQECAFQPLANSWSARGVHNF